MLVALHTCVLLGKVPHLLGDLLEDRFPPDIEFAEVGIGESVSERIEATGADVLILNDEWLGDPSSIALLLDLFPHLRVLVLVSEGRRAYLHKLQPTCRELRVVSLGELLKIIREI